MVMIVVVVVFIMVMIDVVVVVVIVIMVMIVIIVKNKCQFIKYSKLFTITKNQYPPYLKAILDTITNYHSHATKEHITSQLPIPKCKSEFSKKSFFHL